MESERSKTVNELIHLKLTDEERTYSGILATSSIKGDAQGKIDLLEFAIEHKNWNMADSVLSVALADEKTKEEHYLFDNYDDYISFRMNLNERKLSQLDSSEIAYLETLAELDGKVAGYAQNILCFFYNRCYEPEDENLTKNKMIYSPSSMDEKTRNELFYIIGLYPNPAGDYTSIKWEILDQLNDCQYKILT